MLDCRFPRLKVLAFRVGCYYTSSKKLGFFVNHEVNIYFSNNQKFSIVVVFLTGIFFCFLKFSEYIFKNQGKHGMS